MTFPFLARRLFVHSALTLASSVALYSAGCSSDDEGAPPDAENPELADVVYAGEANDEGLEVLLDETVVDDPARAPVVTAPDAGSLLAVGTVVSFQAGPTAARIPASPGAPGQRFRFEQLLAAERLAHAHGAPMNGEAFLLTFASSEEPELLRVFTDESSYTLTAADVAKLSVAAEVTLTLTLGVFEEGRLTPDGGPFESTELSYTVDS